MRWPFMAGSATLIPSPVTDACPRATISPYGPFPPREGGRGLGRSLLQRDLHALVDLALVLRLDDADAADLAGARDMRPTVRLQVHPYDLDDADRLDVRRQQIDLGADQVGN